MVILWCKGAGSREKNINKKLNRKQEKKIIHGDCFYVMIYPLQYMEVCSTGAYYHGIFLNIPYQGEGVMQPLYELEK